MLPQVWQLRRKRRPHQDSVSWHDIAVYNARADASIFPMQSYALLHRHEVISDTTKIVALVRFFLYNIEIN